MSKDYKNRAGAIDDTDYERMCNSILSDTMHYVDTSAMKTYQISKNDIANGNAIYKSAVADKSPITLVYTPAGTGKSAMIKDRVQAIINLGTPASKIMILNMNIAKVKQMSQEMPDVNIMTFSDFTHNIFAANYPECKLSDETSIANMLRLEPHDSITEQFINRLSTYDPRTRATMLSLFVNQNTQQVIDMLQHIGKSEYALESMICHNMMYRFAKNPYDIETILINGVHNMPVPILCSILEYANRYHCNLFMTGSPNETIYEFNMAYKNGMDVLSAYSDKNIGIIRLTESKMSKSIANVLNMTRTSALDNIETKTVFTDANTPVSQSIEQALSVATTTYLSDRLDTKKPVLIIARSKSDINDIKQLLETQYRKKYPCMSVLDLTSTQVPNTSYGKYLSTWHTALETKYPNEMTVRQLGYELYNVLTNAIDNTTSQYKKAQLESDRDNIMSFITSNAHVFGSLESVWNTRELIQAVIETESELIQFCIESIKKNSKLDFTGADIILSTIHSAIDIRNDDVIVFLRNTNENIDPALYRVALSRANESEYLIFANNGNFETSYQRYLKTYIH
jgi:hypothetical protein